MRCGLGITDLWSGDLVHALRIEGIVEELYDVVAIPGVRRPIAIGFRSDEIRWAISVGPTEVIDRTSVSRSNDSKLI